MQAGFGKQVDSPSATAEADVSDVQSVDSSLSRRGTGMSKKDTVCQVGKGPVLQLETMAMMSCQCTASVLSG